MKSPSTKKSAEIHKDVQHQINKINHDIDQIQKRLSPGQILDEIVFHSRDKNLRASFEQLKNNPVGTSFLTIGALLFIEDDQHRTLETRALDKFNQARQGASHLGEEVRDKFPKISVKEKSTEYVQELKQHLPDKEKLKEKISSGQDYAKDLIQNLEPVSFLTLGIGLGILTGISLPVSKKEQEIMSPLANQMDDILKEVKSALNESLNILKNNLFEELKGSDFKVFKN